MGGSYWLHYLVETVPATALAVGVVAGARPRWARAVVCTVVVAATAAWAVGGTMRWPETGSAVGHVLAGSAHRRDTVVSAFGDADLVLASGLSSPYPYLWALPARTLDPHLDVLRSTLAGAGAPTWFVVRGRATLQRLRLGHVGAVLSRRYRPVGEVCGRTVYLLRLTTRPTLGSPRSCTAEPVFSTLRQDAVHDVRAAER
jgi:hypothetical protein